MRFVRTERGGPTDFSHNRGTIANAVQSSTQMLTVKDVLLPKVRSDKKRSAGTRLRRALVKAGRP